MGAFDVVVVGAGSAGARLAAGLSDDPARRILLREPGPDHRSAATPPGVASANFLRAVGEPDRVWPALVATRSPEGAASLYLRGRGVGGSSAVNARCALRGTPEDSAAWDRDHGCTGWGWDATRAAFLHIEDDVDSGGDGLHGAGGSIPLTRLPAAERSPLDRALRAAAVSLG